MVRELPPPDLDLLHNYSRGSSPSTGIRFKATPREMKEWDSYSWWYRLRHRRQSPWQKYWRDMKTNGRSY